MYQMVSEAFAGSNITALSHFQVGSKIDLSRPTVSYELIDSDGIVYVNGLADSISISQTVVGTQDLEGRATITIPTNIPASTKGMKYSLKWTLVTDDLTSYFFETFPVFPQIQVDNGPADALELVGTDATLYAVLPVTDAVLTIHRDNELVHTSPPLTSIGAGAQGENFEYTFSLQTTGLTSSLNSYTLMWTYVDPSINRQEREVARLYVVTSSILNAMKELQTNLNRVGRARDIDDVTFTASELVEYLRMGADKFNATGLVTAITFTNAKWAFRHFWNVCSQVVALRSRYLEEGEKSFNFGGQTVTLDVDITAYLDTIASQLEGWLDSNLPDFKKQMHKKGVIVGDGSNQMTGQSRVNGAVGLSASPIGQLGHRIL